MKPHLVFQDSHPWIDYLPDTWAALRSDNWDHMPFDPKKIYKRFDDEYFTKTPDHFTEEIQIFNALNHALVYGHYFNCHPSELFAAEQLDKANKHKGVVSKNFLNFWRPILGIYLAWADQKLDELRNNHFYSPKMSNRFDLDEFVYDKKYLLSSLTHIRAQGEEDPYHLESHLKPLTLQDSDEHQREIDIYENVIYLTLKVNNFYQLEDIFPRYYSDDYAIARVDIEEFGSLGHFLLTPERHLVSTKKHLSLAAVRFIPDTQLRETANSAFKLRNEL